MSTQTLRFFRRGEIVTVADVTPNQTLLDLLREDLHCTGTKEGCGEGDCGACTVVLGEERDGRLELKPINSCIRLAQSIDGMALWTVEDLAPQFNGSLQSLHPVQQAMVQCHGSQCGFCTPGFVMSLFGLYEQHQKEGKLLPISRTQAQHALSGNLCRCTGYRPILDAAEAMQSLPLQTLDREPVLQGLRSMQQAPNRKRPTNTDADLRYHRPTRLSALLALRARYPRAQLVAGCTDVGLWVTKMHQQFECVIDTTRVRELRRVERYRHHLAIGAAVTLTDAFAALVEDRPQLKTFALRFAGLPVRNAGTLGGNVANGSPIGDSMPLLIALGANVVLMSERGHREMRLEDLYTGYRQNVMAKDEVLAWIKVPKALPQEVMRAYKVSKRFEDDISAVCLAIRLHVEDGVVTLASIGVGGVAATPVRAKATERLLQGQRWSEDVAHLAAKSLQSEFSPISDMRASAHYRRTVLGNLLRRFWLESQSQPWVTLDDLELPTPLGAAA